MCPKAKLPVRHGVIARMLLHYVQCVTPCWASLLGISLMYSKAGEGLGAYWHALM